MHDSAVCLVEDGEIVAYAEEERFSREKHTGRFPARAMRWCLKHAGARFEDIRKIGFYWHPWKGIARRLLLLSRSKPAALINPGGRQRILHAMLRLPGRLKKQFNYTGAFHYLDHHLCHAASSFLLSDFETAAVLSLDANGEQDTGLLAVGTGTSIRELERIPYPHSLGLLYLSVTEYLGFRENWDEGKVMGLAAYGEPRYVPQFRKILRIKPDGGFDLQMKYFDVHLDKEHYTTAEFEQLMGPRRHRDEPLDERHANIACSLQTVYEEALMALLNKLARLSGETRLCFSGGLALNSLANGTILQRTPFKDLFIPPMANDCGCCAGAALMLDPYIKRGKRPRPLSDAGLGPAFSDSEIESVLKENRLQYRKVDDIASVAAEALAQGTIVGWFQGKMEAGPRALGHRSILADPRPQDIKDRLNDEVKRRESFRPYAPAVLEEQAGAYFEMAGRSPYMLRVFKVRDEKQAEIPGVVHTDGTARVQTVSKKDNPLYWNVIESFRQLTGVPLLVNTSFNRRGEPIVCTPEDAVSAFKGTRLGALAIGPFWVERN